MKVSVIIPTFNRVELLKRAAKSVLAQTHRDLEVLIVDDQSTDDTRSFLQHLVHSDSRVKCMRTSKKMHNAARNCGLQFATGDIIGFLDDDDAWAPRKIEAQVIHLEKYSLIGCREEKIGQKRKTTHYPDRIVSLEDFYWSNCGLNPSTILVKRDVVEAVGAFDACLKGAAGMSFIAQVLDIFGPALVVGESLVLRDQNHGYERITGSDAWLAGCRQEYNKNYELRTRAQRKVRAAQLDLYAEISSGALTPTSLGKLWLRGLTWAGFFRWHTILTRLGFITLLRKRFSR